MNSTVVVQLLGLVCQNRSEDSGDLFGQVDSQLHSQTFRQLLREESDSEGRRRVACTSQQHPASTRSR